MKAFVFDTFAIMALFRDETGADLVLDILHDCLTQKAQVYMHAYNAGEVYYMTYRKENKRKAEEAIKGIRHLPIEIIESDLDFSIKAAEIKALYKLSYADAHAAALSIEMDATLVTGDKEFLALQKIISLKMIR